MQLLSLPRQSYASTATILANSQITHYARLNQIDNARRVFDQLPEKNIASWNSIIAGYFQNNQPDEARHLFDIMPERNTVSWNGLISGYVRNGMVRQARQAFDMMPERNVISWTAVIRGYVEQGLTPVAESLFWKMPEKNVVSWTVMLGGLIQDRRIGDARRLYELMPVKDVVAKTNMISGYCQAGKMAEAKKLFDEIPYPNVISWTTMVTGYAQNQQVDVARTLFEMMPEKNEVSWTAMLMAYTQCGRIKEAEELFNAMPMESIIACNTMIVAFGNSGEVSKAKLTFDHMVTRDDISWSTMIKVYERNGFELEAMDLFSLMQSERIRPNFPSLISILSVCASLASLYRGRQIHAQLLRSQFIDDVYVSSVLITMYIKCGDLIKARLVFDNFSPKDTVMWNSIITGYAQYGLEADALLVFDKMSNAGVAADDVTFVGVLSACSYTGKVEEGLKIFESMESKYRVVPKTEHYACMVDLMGRAGRLTEANDLIERMPMKPDATLWGSLMGACRIHKNMDLAEIAAKKLLELEPNNTGPYVLLSNIYASSGRWNDVADLRRNMVSRNMRKSPGCSWIEVEKRVHTFTGGESTPHPEHLMIIKKLEELSGLLKEAGYAPDSSFTLHDIDEEEKVQSLGHHSEKLAVAYGLLKVPKGMPIRVMKNLRVCGDCHSAIKLIAMVTKRVVILRDANRFHHFENGSCSCHDYW
ncbi:pentatricopeptide repeat-containing protein At1g56690, mitochondrial-like [Impatiens glandulifera]|uniref:pentatricopeptide repeat-containing protein At1g56690, mitochondrial-like n=1 Tax=Impatiens glandulifera TaxID=253017 RepID=UPI001FB0B279|nr:pentatricopeptide repeat-containing protein At1g56690, mitochondrial-like [Impatiens glandulifera]